MRSSLQIGLALCACMGLSARFSRADEAAATQAELEAKFAATMSNAVLRGSYTLGEIKPGEALKEDSYTLGEVKKLPSGKWLFNTRIQYGEHDVTVPLALDVAWAGDTPVITLTKLPVPGLGTFTARVLVYDNEYAGTWNGGDHGGHLFGKVEHPEKEKGAGEGAPPER